VVSSGAGLGIEATGLSSALQDRGRLGLRRLGIPWAGTLAESWRHIANALVGNPIDAPVVETFEAGLTVQARDGAVRIATVGDLTLEHGDAQGSSAPVLPWRSVTLQPGERVRVVSTGRFRLGLLALAGIDVPVHHGSRSSYARAGLGGLDGRPLVAGDRLPTVAGTHDPDLGIAEDDLDHCLDLARAGGGEGTLLLRAVPGPQDEAFDADQLARFFGERPWTVSRETDRMGCRLDGEPLVHRHGADIVSDAIVPGSVQVPGTGRPIVLLNDAHTAGGYTKIATVIGTDLMALALARPGAKVRFAPVEAAEGVRLARHRHTVLTGILERLTPPVRVPGTAELLGANLIGGVVNALEDAPA